MALLRIPLSAVSLLIALLFLPGCIAFYGHRQVEVKVIDAETQEPIPGARVEVTHMGANVLNYPNLEFGITNSDGCVVVHAAEYGGEQWRVRAPMYGFIFGPAFPSKDRPSSLTLRINRDRDPSITIIVPDRFRGALLVERIGKIDHPKDDGARQSYTYRPGSNGYVEIRTIPLLIDARIAVVNEQLEYLAWSEFGPLHVIVPRRIKDAQGNDIDSMESVKRQIIAIGSEKDQKAVEQKIHRYRQTDNGPISEGLNDAAFNRLFEEARDAASAHPAP